MKPHMHDTDNMPSSTPSEPGVVPSTLKFPVVGIGASAGGLPALLRFFENMPRQTGMAFVVILHLSPKHKSSADQVLQRATRMPVTQVVETVRIEPDHIYVIPPNRHLTMVDGVLSLTTSIVRAAATSPSTSSSGPWPRCTASARWRS
jgi:two-component system CheB/CheR fusion protein